MNKFLLFFTNLAMTASLVVKVQQPQPILRVGLAADIQYADAETRDTRYYRNSLQKLKTGVADASQVI